MFQCTTVAQKRNNLLEHIKKEIPNFELRSKEKSKLFNLLSYLMFFNKGIKDRYITTVYPYIYVPKFPWMEGRPIAATGILSHEYVHLLDRKRLGPLFNLLYFSPQVFSIFSLLAMTYSNLWLLCLLFLLPIPSPGRAWIEMRGYRANIAVWFWLTGTKYDIDFVIKQFTDSGYYWMMPFENWIRKMFEKTFNDIKNDILTSELVEIKTALKV